MSDRTLTKDLDARRSEIVSLLAEQQRNQLAKFDKRTLAWLALVPAWTEQLALECKLFPSSEILRNFAHAAQAEKLCNCTASTTPERFIRHTTSIFTSLAPYLSVPRQKEALHFIQSIKNTRLQAQSLIKFAPYAPYLAPGLLPVALTGIRAFDNPVTRTTTLLTLLPLVSEEERSTILQDARQTLGRLTDVEEKTTVLLALLPHYAEEQRTELLQHLFDLLAQEMPETQRATVLIGMALYLSPSFLSSALDITQSFTEHDEQVQVWLALAEHAPSEQQRSILWQAQAILASDQDMEQATRTNLLALVAQQLAYAGEYDRALKMMDEITDEDTRVHTSLEIVQTLSQHTTYHDIAEQVERLLKTALRPMDTTWNVTILTSIAQILLQSGEKVRATDIAQRGYGILQDSISTIGDTAVIEPRCIEPLAAILTQVGKEAQATQILEQGLVVARAINDTRDKCRAMTNLVRYLPAPQQNEVVQEILKAVRQIGDVDARIQGLINVAPYLEEKELDSVLDEALRLAKSMEGEFSFWMPDAVRTEVLSMFSQNDSTFLMSMLQEISQPILQAQQNIPIPPAIIRWAEIAAQAEEGTEAVAYWLDEKIERLVDAGDTGLALAWISTATMLLPILQGELAMSVLLGQRRVEMAYRQVQDQRHLQYFLQRPEQIDVFFKNLMVSPQTADSKQESPWALHYVGIGGIGKTTLLRYITARLTKDKIPVSRVDFDFLNPDYPSRRPGQLLIELAKELQSYGKSRQHETLFRTFQQQVVHFHEVLSSQPAPANPLANIHHPEFISVIQAFIGFLKSLTQPVVLILDTCEELAKFQPRGVSPPNIEATFDILERIHDQISTIRVVFAGRRLLVQQGANWEIDEQHLQEGQSFLRTKKSYLLLHEIQGFTEKEALDFLTMSKKLDISPDLQQAILQWSPDPGMSSHIRWNTIVVTATSTTPPAQRYNPFDVALYANWIQEDATVTAQRINEGTIDPYIEQRIVQRVRQPHVAALLPAVTLLQRFNKDMLRLAFDGDDVALDEAFRDLGNLEWIEYHPEDKTTFLEIDRNLYPRLLAYYQHSDQNTLLASTRHRLRPALFDLVSRAPLDQLYIEYVEAALRLLQPEDSAELWDIVTQRLLQAGDWSKLRTITRRILDDSTTSGSNARTTTLSPLATDTSIIGIHHRARAAVRATFIAVLLHDQPEMRVDSYWNEVAHYADADPNPLVAQWLFQRAIIGTIATIRITRELPLHEQLLLLWQIVQQFPRLSEGEQISNSWYTEQLAASLCAALDALLEFTMSSNTSNTYKIVPAPRLVADWATVLRKYQFSKELQAFATMLAGRAMILHEHWDEADALFRQANAALPKNEVRLQRWADWRIPDSLHDRVRLEIVRALPRHRFSLSSETLLHWQQEAISRLSTIDADRLVSYILTLRLAHGIVPKAELDTIAIHDVYHSQRQPACKAHRDIYPLFASRATALLAAGESTAALRIVNERIEAVAKTGLDLENTVQTAEHTKARILRRMRAAKSEPVFVERLAFAKDMGDRIVIWPAIALGYPPNQRLIPSAPNTDNLFHIHDWWRNSSANKVTAALLQDSVSALQPQRFTTFVEGSLTLDVCEAQLIEGKKPKEHITEQFDFNVWLAHYPTHIERGFRLWLRSIALQRAVPGGSKEIQNEWADRVGAHRIAELALREGEVLALRLPQNAEYLLNLAYQLFRKAGDPIGTFIASLCSTIAYIRAGIPINDNTRQTLKNRLKEAYESLPHLSDLEWIPWNDLLHNHLKRINVQSDGNGMLWQGWLERLVTCMLWLNEDNDALTRWRMYRLISQYREPLPLELDLLLPHQPQADMYEIFTERIPPTIFAVNIDGEPLFSWQKLPAYTAQSVTIETPQQRIEKAPLPDVQSYRDAAQQLPPAVIQELAARQKQLGEHILPVPLTIYPGLHALPWEALLTLALPDANHPLWKETFQFYRKEDLLLVSQSATSKQKPRSSYSIGVLSSPSWHSMTSRGWQTKSNAVTVCSNLYDLQRLESGLDDKLSILHVICTPTLTTSGWLVQIGSTNQYYSAYSSSKVEEVVRGDDGSRLIRVENLPLASTSLVVLQAEPVETPQRLDSERTQTSELRSCAAAAFSTGAITVLLLPALSSSLTEVILHQLAECWEDEANLTLHRILDTVSSIRRSIATWSTTASGHYTSLPSAESVSSEIQRELALDISLFTRI